MRIATTTLLVVLVCLIGGLGSTGVVATQYMGLVSAQKANEEAQLYKRDIGQLESVVSQWLTTIDLFFGYEQSYLGAGVMRQSKELRSLLSDLNNAHGASDVAEFAKLEYEITAIVSMVESVYEVGSDDSKKWNDALSSIDESSATMVDVLFDLVQSIAETADSTTVDLTSAETRLNITIWICLGVYLALVLSAWVWANKRIVRPLVKLSLQTQKRRDEVRFDIESAPKEIDMLAAEFGKYAKRIASEKSRAEQQQQMADRAKRRVDAVMNTVADGIISINSNYVVESANAAAETIFGCDTQGPQLIGISLRELLLQPIEQARRDGTFVEATLLRLDGEQMPIELNANSTEIEGEEKLTVVLHDVTARKEKERQVKELNQRLLDASRQVGIAEVATSILHNVGNALNSVNTAVAVIGNKLGQSRLPGLAKGIGLLDTPEKMSALADDDSRTEKVLGYFRALNDQLGEEQQAILEELGELDGHVRHIETIVRSQQSNATHSTLEEELDLKEILEESINMNKGSLDNRSIRVVREYGPMDVFLGERHRIAQILVNLVRNATDAINDLSSEDPSITLRTGQDEDFISVSVTDNGIGMDEEVLQGLFKFGFTTKKDGHGFGLHSCILEARNMGGTIEAASDGRGLGSTFTLKLPRNGESVDVAVA